MDTEFLQLQNELPASTRPNASPAGVALRNWSLVIALAALSCSTAPDDCAGVGVDGIRLTVVDSATGSDLTNAATATVRQLSPPYESRTGSLVNPPSPLGLAADHPGSYHVTVAADGYLNWTSMVEVRTDGERCAQTVTTTVTARLVRG
jgi:hypothetical protein